jgi:cytochrome c55X
VGFRKAPLRAPGAGEPWTRVRVQVRRLLGMGLVVGLSASLVPPAALAAPDAQRQRELIRLVRQDCGACHGMTLKGGLGSSLTPAALNDKPPEALVATVLGGRAGTAMAAWGSLLDPDEAAWIVARLREGFPELTR